MARERSELILADIVAARADRNPDLPVLTFECAGKPDEVLTFADLQIGTLGLDGEVALLLGGGCREGDDGCLGCRDGDPECMSMRENQQTLTADLAIESGTSATLVIEGMQVVHDDTGTVLDGSAEVSSAMSSGTLNATAVRWNPMECLPSSGTVVYGPTTGNVMVTIPPFPTVETMLFEACPAP